MATQPTAVLRGFSSMAARFSVLGVVGAGQMGSGIAQVAATASLDVILSDVDQRALDRGMQTIKASLTKFVTKGTLGQEEAEKIMKRVQTTTTLEDFHSADVVIEAVAENEALKRRIFSELDKIVAKEAILASNTSSISITRIAAATQRPERVIGMHFMNPVPLMKLVEIVRGIATDDAVFEDTKQLAHWLGKTVCCSKDYPGFIVNRVLMPMINEAFYALYEGVASAQDIDLGMKLGTNQPMGPLTLADFIGLDTCLAIMRVLHDGLGDSKYRPCPLLVQYVDAGWLGKKVGKGVYNYSKL
ncbi:3-hydroxy-2-methylbutyryl-CoA dehydrogenase [Klebsormidium nitens]|uniref:3-hydroxy-2-methylbutyryl-CoA dehydrogenase n=1 Tax=Klebsormidium nitens TaxID=105231 RepID=A0A1Y1I928_KLENI|nr:3-hydroxy-2-methylbutyryl-CoA dehydrogenase [Klebsormidium nitens]|eukprot:GAQ85919.1 3-hydroxy-2-methylbutyryl-CoA dehydrogenase [Klebsormidium nitens]